LSFSQKELKKRNRTAALIVAACVLSHWALDFITHRPDLLLAPGSDIYVGLGLWNSVAGTIIVEGALFAAGLVLYLHTTQAKDRIGTYGFWALIVFFTATYFANLFGPPPPDESIIATWGNTGWLLVLWGWWVDRHRTVVDQ
jgi:hypothetical protein